MVGCLTDDPPDDPAAERWLLRHRYFGQLLALAERVVCPSADLAERVRTMAPLANVEEMPLAIKLGDERSALPSRQPGALRLGIFGNQCDVRSA